MTALREESNQKRGLVTVGYTMDTDYAASNERLQWEIAAFPMYKEALPLKNASWHFCYNNATMKAALSLILPFCPPKIRVRYRDHYGTCGIPAP